MPPGARLDREGAREGGGGGGVLSLSAPAQVTLGDLEEDAAEPPTADISDSLRDEIIVYTLMGVQRTTEAGIRAPAAHYSPSVEPTAEPALARSPPQPSSTSRLPPVALPPIALPAAAPLPPLPPLGYYGAEAPTGRPDDDVASECEGRPRGNSLPDGWDSAQALRQSLLGLFGPTSADEAGGRTSRAMDARATWRPPQFFPLDEEFERRRTVKLRRPDECSERADESSDGRGSGAAGALGGCGVLGQVLARLARGGAPSSAGAYVSFTEYAPHLWRWMRSEVYGNSAEEYIRSMVGEFSAAARAEAGKRRHFSEAKGGGFFSLSADQRWRGPRPPQPDPRGASCAERAQASTGVARRA